MDKLEAGAAFKGNVSNPKVYECVKGMLSDKWNGHRGRAIELLDEVADAKAAELKPLLMNMAKTDETTKVRAQAIEFLAKHYKGDADVKDLCINALSEKSYLVMGAGLNALAKENPTLAMQKAKDLENENSDNIRFTIMDLYSNYGDDKNNTFFLSQKDNFSGFEAMGFINMYGQFLKRCTDPTVVSGAAVVKVYTEKGKGNAYVKFVAQKVLKDLYNRYQDSEDELISKKDDASVKRLGEVTATKNKLKAILDEAKQ